MTLKNLSILDLLLMENLLENEKSKIIDYLSKFSACDRCGVIDLKIYQNRINDVEKILSKVKGELYGNNE